jgi:hypothetical protein
MQALNVPIDPLHIGALDAALKAALPDKVIGISGYGSARPITIWLDDSTSEGDQIIADSTAQAHDPVFLSVDKTEIVGDGVDTATITVNAPKVGAAPVVLLIDGSAVPVTLTNGIGTVPLSSDPATVHVTVQNPENRTTDVITIEAR